MKCNKVLLYGGSFNPIHQGHINAAINAFHYLQCDEVWLIPRKYNYDGSLLLDSKYRLDMIKMAIDDFNYFKILDIELKDKERKLIYSYNTAKEVLQKWPENKYYFLIGADQLNNIANWFKIEELVKMMSFVCYRRPGYKINMSFANKYHVQIIDGEQVDISSTQVRTGYFTKVDNDIQKYIIEHQLYLKERILGKLADERYIHSLSTAKLCADFAKGNNVNCDMAYTAGILHDISKGLLHDEIENILLEYYPSKVRLPHYCHHRFASEYIAKHNYSITNNRILKAIRNHARPTDKLTKLDKIVYCADKLELSRPFSDSLANIREIGYKDIDTCFVLTLQEQIKYLTDNNQRIDKNIYKQLKKYKEE